MELELVDQLSPIAAHRWKENLELLFLPSKSAQSLVEELQIQHRAVGELPVGEYSGSVDTHLQAKERAGNPEIDSGEEVKQHRPLVFLEHKSDATLRNSNHANTETRIFLISQKHSWSNLRITHDLFNSVMLSQSIPAHVMEQLVYFGARGREAEVAPPPLKSIQRRFGPDRLDILSEWTYILRFVEPNGRGSSEKPTTQWSLRQSLIHSRTISPSAQSSWLCVALSQSMRSHLQSALSRGEIASLTGPEPFGLHILFLQRATSNWRHYLVDLRAEVDEHQGQIAGTLPDAAPMTLEEPDRREELIRRQELLTLETKILDAILVVRSTVYTVSRLRDGLLGSEDLLTKHMDVECTTTSAHFEDLLRELDLTLVPLEQLKTKLDSITRVLDSFIGLSSGLTLESLATESAKETAGMTSLSRRMHKLAERSTQDAAAIKVLTIVTLVYLPMTVVSNFFSTSFVSTTILDGSASGISISKDWWIFVAVSAPLTTLTVYVWFVWMRIKAYKKYPWWWENLRRRQKTQSDDTLVGEKDDWLV